MKTKFILANTLYKYLFMNIHIVHNNNNVVDVTFVLVILLYNILLY